MKKLLLILLFPFAAFAQSVPQSLVWMSTLADLRASSPISNQSVTLLGLTSATDNNGGNYLWNATSTATDDGFITIQATGITTGRWIRIGNSNSLKISASVSAISLQNTYTFPFGTTFPFTPRMVVPVARSTNAGVGMSVGTITSSSVQIIFNSIPLLGTLSVDLLIIKQ